MDELLQRLLRELTQTDPAAAGRLRDILAGGLSPLALLRALYQLLMEGLIDRELLMRLLRMYGRAGIIDSELLTIAVAEAEADLAVTTVPWWKRLPKGLRALWLIPIYMAIALAVDSQVEQEKILSGLGPCGDNSNLEQVTVSESSYGAKSALKDALASISDKCSNSGLACIDEKCETCDKDIAVGTVEIKNRILWYTAEVTGTCLCWCKE